MLKLLAVRKECTFSEYSFEYSENIVYVCVCGCVCVCVCTSLYM